MVGQCHRPGNGAGGHSGEEVLLLLGRADLAHDRGELGDGGQEGTGSDGPAELFDHDGGLENGQPDAAVLLGDGQGGPVEGDHGAPQLLGGLAGLDHGPYDVDGALLLEEGATESRSSSCSAVNSSSTALPSRPCRFASRALFGASVGAHRSGRVYLTPMSGSGACVTLTPPRFLGRTWLGSPGGSSVRGASPGRRHGGACGGPGGAGAGHHSSLRSPLPRAKPPRHRRSLAYTLRCASSSTAEQRTLNPQVSGSNPEGRTRAAHSLASHRPKLASPHWSDKVSRPFAQTSE